MSAPKEILELVERFKRNLEEYKQLNYKEARVRQDFINPFFKLLGWDINNKEGLPEDAREVVVEDSIEIQGKQKAPDYCFRVKGDRIFFVEAKKPGVNIKESIDPAYQIRRYGYTAKLPVSILTDFEEFAIYDTRIKPNKKDGSRKALLFYCRYEEYAEKFDDIYKLFAKENVQKGSLKDYLGTKLPKGAYEVDKEFLKMIEDWRSLLAKNIAINNLKLEIDQLNLAVQKIIDRILFLRIAEDRGIENSETLLKVTKEKRIYPALVLCFERANRKYNSELFKSDIAIDSLAIENKVLEEIITGIYYPDCPYALAVLPIEMLGNIYEQFLGKTIRLTEGHQAKVEEKPEVRKAGGVYYTPKYIVDYIVKNTVGEKIKGATPKEIERLKILDPACGSGSFLLGAYNCLMTHHLAYYTKPANRAKALKDGRVWQAANGSFRLTIKEKQDILLNNIFGVDIDAQAVEVTKLSLMLKLLEGEGDESAGRLFKYSQEKLLPNLSGNIKCGNSLIGPDFYKDKNLSLFDSEEMKKINTFDWNDKIKGFGEIMDKGGFDCVIGNPPYVRQESLSEFKKYFEAHYQVYQGAADLYSYFIEKGVGLLKNAGLFSYIVANKWMRANYGSLLRNFLKNSGLSEIVDFGDLRVFENATTYPCVVKVKKGAVHKTIAAVNVTSLEFSDLSEYAKDNCFVVDLSDLSTDGWALVDKKTSQLLDKLRKSGVSLGEYVNNKIYRGVLTGLNEAFVINEDTKNRLIKEDPKSAEIIKPLLAGRDIKRYENLETDKYLILIPNGWTNRNRGAKNAENYFCSTYPSVSRHLKEYENQAKARYDKGDYWWELRKCAYYNEFKKPKFLLPDISLRGNFAYDPTGEIYCVNTAYIIVSDDKRLLGILNSKLMTFFYKHLSAVFRGGYLRFIYQYLVQLPIASSLKTDRFEKKMDALVVQMLETQKKCKSAKSENDKKHYQQKMEIIDNQIDRLVYELYGLTEEEIRVVEENK
ncbi:MAG: TaqI-like C-terminal specificity domain-containing protein [Candidatus Margulisiibacteriota bacterium]